MDTSQLHKNLEKDADLAKGWAKDFFKWGLQIMGAGMAAAVYKYADNNSPLFWCSLLVVYVGAMLLCFSWVEFKYHNDFRLYLKGVRTMPQPRRKQLYRG